jgi:hypothetical protein
MVSHYAAIKAASALHPARVYTVTGAPFSRVDMDLRGSQVGDDFNVCILAAIVVGGPGRFSSIS